MSTQAYKRLNKEYKQIQANPPPYIIARPSESNILDWHYIITGPPGTPYENGQYHGRITFPSDYPFKPPRIKMCTPSGRFEINQRLCLSMSDFHEESWNPSWSVATIITGLLSFMTGDERTTGSIVTSNSTKIQLAAKSKEYNTYSNPAFKEVFPELWQQNLIDIENKKNENINEINSNSINSSNMKPEDSKVIEDIEKIQDPEDKIRARLLKTNNANAESENGSIKENKNLKNSSKNSNSNSNTNTGASTGAGANGNASNTMFYVITAVIIGVTLKSIGLI
ncbi:Ubiquitin-conjugating enzyme E2 6 [Pichia californica]|uniref:Ubiquitin-conjugating enzyme E2 6 n=1 Tax=Pichia californica TaxID=460514 RepID=A0A9P7BHQ4_9ASCO|nr:Ubiquitin-conjugating enzyme E2 6 [[Candida] californica]KAG0690785.1 Ubiquitin-conjugating enzyme E2 6 [[Candida] californica]